MPRDDKVKWSRILNAVIGALVVAIVVVGGFFGFFVWRTAQMERTATPALRAIDDLKELVREHPDDAGLRVRLGEAFATAGYFPEAIGQFEAALQINEEHTGALLDLGLVYYDMGEWDPALLAFERLLDLTEGEAFAGLSERRELALYYLGVMAVEQEAWEDAIGYLKGALRIRRDASDTYYHLARALVGVGDSGGALDQLDSALAFDPNYAEVHFLKGQILLDSGLELEAATHLRAAMDLQPDSVQFAQALESLGTVDERLAAASDARASGDPEESLHQVLIARALDSSNVEVLGMHAELLEESGDVAGALSVFEDILALYPDNEQALGGRDRLEGMVE